MSNLSSGNALPIDPHQTRLMLDTSLQRDSKKSSDERSRHTTRAAQNVIESSSSGSTTATEEQKQKFEQVQLQETTLQKTELEEQRPTKSLAITPAIATQEELIDDFLDKLFATGFEGDKEKLRSRLLKGKLCASGNLPQGLPREIGNLTNLTSLVLSDNNLTSLPPEIVNLAKLTTLALFDNNLTTLPPEIGKLINLITNCSFFSGTDFFPPSTLITLNPYFGIPPIKYPNFFLSCKASLTRLPILALSLSANSNSYLMVSRLS